ncbi:MAG TPA: fibronectin type III domain-containing protein, partial [Armatimonadota bacterium]|nr:fibronectin type III domain-containing protein [Armatimonadota bacterium]
SVWWTGNSLTPSAPTGLTAAPGDTKVALSWTASAGATSYNVKRSTTTGGPYTTVGSPTTSSYTDTGLTDGAAYYYVVSAVNASGESPDSAEVEATPSIPTNAAAVFVGADTTTQGNWKGVYGADGYNVFEDTASYPAYATLGRSGAGDYTWDSAPTDVRGLERGGNGRIAACWFSSSTSFSMDLDLADGHTHRVALYLLDLDNFGRTETVQVTDATTGVVLDSENASSFYSGEYLVWNITGHVKLNVINTGPENSVCSGIFFDPDSAGAPSAPTGLTAAAGNTQVALSWTASAGATSYNVKRATTSGGPYTTVGNPTTTSCADSGLTNGAKYYYVVSAVDSGGESANSSQVSATPEPPAPPAPTGLSATSGNKQIALSWTASTGAATYNVKRSTTNGGPYTTAGSATTTSYTDSGLTNGTTYYYVVSAVNAGGESANSTQIGAAPQSSSKGAGKFMGTDTTTQGSWKGVYGADGYDVFEDSASLPGYATLAPSSTKRDYTWNSAPTDVRALARGTATGRIAACWYNPSSFSMDLNLTDGQTHRVAFYFLDWEPEGRTETIQILDAATGAVLDSENVSSFYRGKYLVWNLSGHVMVSVTNAGASALNTVCSGVFFDAPVAPVAPAAPTGVTAVAGNANVSLSWAPSNFATSYNVKRATTSGGPYTTVASSTTTSYTDAGVTNGTTYYYVVSAVNAGGESANSSEISALPMASMAAFLGTDTTTQGSWKGVYGADGYNVFEDSASLPAYATLTPSSTKRDYTWNSAPTDVRALARGTTSGRIAACWYNPTSFNMDLNLSDGLTHRVAFYFLDWEPCNRVGTVQILDAVTGTVLDSEPISSFTGGKYLIWNLSGHLTVKVTNTAVPNCVCSGVFFR